MPAFNIKLSHLILCAEECIPANEKPLSIRSLWAFFSGAWNAFDDLGIDYTAHMLNVDAAKKTLADHVKVEKYQKYSLLDLYTISDMAAEDTIIHFKTTLDAIESICPGNVSAILSQDSRDVNVNIIEKIGMLKNRISIYVPDSRFLSIYLFLKSYIGICKIANMPASNSNILDLFENWLRDSMDEKLSCHLTSLVKLNGGDYSKDGDEFFRLIDQLLRNLSSL